MARPKTLHVGASIAARSNTGNCWVSCEACGAWTDRLRSWRAAKRLARRHVCHPAVIPSRTRR